MFFEQHIRFHLIRQQLPPAPAKILEVGCGDGALLRVLLDLGYDACGCELSPELVARAANSGLGEKVFCSSGTELPVADDSYDAVISSDVLEHVPPEFRRKFLGEMVRVARPQGRVVLTYWSRNNRAFRIYGGYHLWKVGYLPQWYMEHITLTPPDMIEVETWLAQMGRILVTRKYQGPVNMLLCCVGHLHQQTLPRVNRFLIRNFLRILALDRFGGCSSQMIALEKSRPQVANPATT